MDPTIDAYKADVHHGAPSLLDMILEADIIVQLDLLILVLMSIACWAIIFQKAARLSAAEKQTQSFLELFWASKRLDAVYEKTGTFTKSPVNNVFKAGYKELARLSAGGHGQDPGANLDRTLRKARQVETTELESYISFLATTGSTAPFIGLFGTVWGILQAFLKLGQPGAAATIQVVGPDIAHSLVATAVGLVAAIPAVWAFNYFNARLHVLSTEMDNFSSDFMNLVKRRAS
ncbi:MAG: protein TolQ [Myxococcota bacterium]